jgi:copper(I)-binding protein
MRRAFLAAILLTSLASTGNTQAMPGSRQDLSVTNAWARPSAGAATTGAAYFTAADNIPPIA